ncbi:MAG: hypothetical protein WCP32_14800 [Bacteroidota bacterium]
MKSEIRKHALLIFCLLIYTSDMYAQDSVFSLSSPPRKPDNFWRRVAIGGNLGFQVGSITGITLSPEVRIRTIDQLNVGVRFIYQYYSYRDYFLDTHTGEFLPFQSNVFGGGIYLRYYLSSIFESFLANLFAHIEYEYMTYSRPFIQTAPPEGYITDGYYYYKPGKEIIEINSIFVGGGYRQPIGNRVSMDLLILFNINDTYNSPYTNPIIRLGVGVGL